MSSQPEFLFHACHYQNDKNFLCVDWRFPAITNSILCRNWNRSLVSLVIIRLAGKNNPACLLIKQLAVGIIWTLFTKNFKLFHHLTLKKVRLNNFLAAKQRFTQWEKFGHDIARILRPCGGLIGIDKSSLEKYLKASKILILHVILHAAGAFIQEQYKVGRRYVCMLPYQIDTHFFVLV